MEVNITMIMPLFPFFLLTICKPYKYQARFGVMRNAAYPPDIHSNLE